MSDEDIPTSDDLEKEDVLEEQTENAEITPEEEGFLVGYNEDIEPDTSDEEGLDEDERIEN